MKTFDQPCSFMYCRGYRAQCRSIPFGDPVWSAQWAFTCMGVLLQGEQQAHRPPGRTEKNAVSPSKCFARTGREVQSPRKHRQAEQGRRSRMPFSASRFFSALAKLTLSTPAAACAKNARDSHRDASQQRPTSSVQQQHSCALFPMPRRR